MNEDWADAFTFDGDTGTNGCTAITAVGGRVFRRVQYKPFKDGQQYQKAVVAELDGVYVYLLNGGRNMIVTKEKLI